MLFFILQLELLVEPLGSSLNTLVEVLRLGTLALSCRLLTTRAATNDLGHGSSPLLGSDTLVLEVLKKALANIFT